MVISDRLISKSPDGDKNALFKYDQEKMTNICYVYLFVHLLIYYLLRTNGVVALTYYPIIPAPHTHTKKVKLSSRAIVKSMFDIKDQIQSAAFPHLFFAIFCSFYNVKENIPHLVHNPRCFAAIRLIS